MLTVWCIWWRDPDKPNKYTAFHVKRLQREVDKYLTPPRQYRFVCITRENVDGVITYSPHVDWPGWWQKIQLFRPGVGTAINLYLDLDVVITGDLSEMVAACAEQPLSMPLNWAQSGHGGCQSSVMLWTQAAQNYRIYQEFKPAWAHWPPINQPGVLWGDQEWIGKQRDDGRIQVTPINAAWVKSYKYHCRGGLPDDCRVVVFHGQPKPETVSAPWFQW